MLLWVARKAGRPALAQIMEIWLPGLDAMEHFEGEGIAPGYRPDQWAARLQVSERMVEFIEIRLIFRAS